jgi:uncharacterized protein
MNPHTTACAGPSPQAPPWWRVGFVWLVVGGPLAVVVASMVTLAIAVSGAEEVLTAPSQDTSASNSATVPAVQGRNHVATPKP